MLHFDETPTRKARIEIIPMIDVMMFLLIFFVLISTNVIPSFGLKTALPDSKTAQRTVSDQKPVIVTLGADGTVALDGQTVAADQLGVLVKRAAQAEVKKRFIINADHAVQWQSVVDVMDTLRASGIESITFATKRVGG